MSILSKIIYPFKRTKLLVESNYGREFGWYIEFEGEYIAELLYPRNVRMFWVEYFLVLKTKNAKDLLKEEANWNNFKYRNKVIPEYAESAFAALKTHPYSSSNVVEMRGLYFYKRNMFEVILFNLLYYGYYYWKYLLEKK